MRHVDVFNGDADGLCALRQLRLADPQAAELVTGLKHDIALLDRVHGADDTGPEGTQPFADGLVVTVLDVSFARNRSSLERLLGRGARITYVDHHMPGEVPHHPGLTVHIDTTPSVCTSVIADRLVGGRFRAWAIAGAFGDNLAATAEAMCDGLGLRDDERDLLRDVGECLNYNAYGDTLDDIAIHPADLYRVLARHEHPSTFARDEPILGELRRHRADDFEAAGRIAPLHVDPRCAVYRLPDAGWSRRVLGPFANRLAIADPARAHAVLKERADGDYSVSLRAPLRSPGGADALARLFGGAGRESAAGIDRLPAARLDEFVATVSTRAWRRA